MANEILGYVLMEAVWINIYKHSEINNYVEIRTHSGHGFRWDLVTGFVGALDPIKENNLEQTKKAVTIS